ncbi:MAG: DUF6061 family protein [Clostridiales bacterium]|nr:DUF6061 family protein [Clostridiales bacterium]MCD8126983.1 DUF6061 family protein [Clostridiales bacterium]
MKLAPVPMQTKIDRLIYNEPVTYADLLFSDGPEQYARDMAGTHGMVHETAYLSSHYCSV